MRESLFRFEKQFEAQGFSRIAGVDEAGRGPLAGPVVAAAVVIPKGAAIAGVFDSKQLTPEKRDSLFVKIMEYCEVGIGVVNETKIDDINIYQASRLAMKLAIESLNIPPQAVLADGKMNLDIPYPFLDIIHGDCLSASIAAASIIAKVTRDQMMLAYHDLDPRYAFHQHKGYSTEDHLGALKIHGACSFHRQSFYPIHKDVLPAEVLDGL